MRHLIPLFLSLFSAALPAQQNLLSSQPFFEATLPQYQRWLDGCGLGPALQLRSVEVKTTESDTLLLVFMGFQSADPDTAKATWDRLRADYARKTKGEALEALLFDKIGWYFEVPRAQTRLYLSDNRLGSKANCWEARVLPGRDGQPLLQEKNYDCGFRSQDFPVSIGPQDLYGVAQPSVAAFQRQMDKKAVFQKLKPWLTQRFEKAQADGGWSHLRFTDEWNTLRFEVRDLRQTVIHTNESSWLCEALCSCRTCQPRELLEVTLKYLPLSDGTGGFELTANIAAKYGSGIWEPRTGGWHDLDDEPAKKDLLRKYGEGFMYDLKAFLTKP